MRLFHLHIRAATARTPQEGFTLPLRAGFTIMEILLGGAILAVGVAALFGAYLGQSHLNTSARNLTLAMHDATRVMEAIRQQNIGCTYPSAVPPSGYQSKNWNAWLAAQSPGKSLPADAYELIVVSCQNDTGTQSCSKRAGKGNQPKQMGDDDWNPSNALQTALDPIRVTVAVGWVQNGRVVGGISGAAPEFTYTPPSARLFFEGTIAWAAPPPGTGGPPATTGPPPTPGLAAGPDRNNNSVIDSQAMITSLVTCRPAPPATTTAAPPPTT